MSTWRGELVNGTYCDRVLTKCDTRACRLQSPNYPGVYPRNVTCYYRVEQNRAPPGHRALLAVSQRNSHKIHIKDQIVKYDGSQRILRYFMFQSSASNLKFKVSNVRNKNQKFKVIQSCNTFWLFSIKLCLNKIETSSF